jgi:hypothetical protein
VGYSDVLSLNIVSSRSFTRHDLPALLATHFVGEQTVQTSMLLTVTARHAASIVFFYTDGIDGCAGFAFHRTGEGGFGYKISSPAGIFTAELTALFVTLRVS